MRRKSKEGGRKEREEGKGVKRGDSEDWVEAGGRRRRSSDRGVVR